MAATERSPPEDTAINLEQTWSIRQTEEGFRFRVPGFESRD